ncbi:MAG: RNA methyltransferase [Pseudomonadota bacterium]|jgi:tRNA (guanosine-2'-O-)-methyltransferase
MNENDRLQDFLLPQRLERLREVLLNRVVSVTLVLENLHKDYNISAILRTCESFGIHEVHVVPQPGEGKVFKTVTQGCHKWLSIKRHDQVLTCMRELKGRGFKILAGAFSGQALPLEQTDFSGRVALVFSNELEGASREVLAEVDGFFNIPMSGFSQSLNVSVAAGIVIHHVLRYKRDRGEALERIPEADALWLLDEWIKKSVRNADEVLMELRSRT